jgi:hypothetical protein
MWPSPRTNAVFGAAGLLDESICCANQFTIEGCGHHRVVPVLRLERYKSSENMRNPPTPDSSGAIYFLHVPMEHPLPFGVHIQSKTTC